MSWNVFYILALLLHCALNYETDESELDNANEISTPMEDFEEIMPMITDSDKENEENVIKSYDEDKRLNDEIPEAKAVSFAGPVKAGGKVAVAANYGYNPPPGFFDYLPYHPYPTMDYWLPPLTPQYFYPLPYAHPIPYSFPYISTATWFPLELYAQSGLEKSQIKKPKERSKTNGKRTQSEENIKLDAKLGNLDKPNTKVCTSNKDIFIEITPKKKIEAKTESKGDIAKPEEILITENVMSTDPVTFLDEDFTDYNENDDVSDNFSKTYDIQDNNDMANVIEDEKEIDIPEERMVFSGYVPAKGAVTIAARF